MDSTEAVSYNNPFYTKAKVTPGAEVADNLYKFAGSRDHKIQ
jgi:hypothetical protein